MKNGNLSSQIERNFVPCYSPMPRCSCTALYCAGVAIGKSRVGKDKKTLVRGSKSQRSPPGRRTDLV